MSDGIGRRLTVSLYGGSHEEVVGVLAEGFPAGFPVDEEALRRFLARRAPGRSPLTTPRKEEDIPEFLSGLQDGYTTGEPLRAVIRNRNTRSGDYDAFADLPRPSHADWAARIKYGEGVDLRGGGRFSGRLTAPLCVAGGIALQMLSARGITVGAHLAAVGGVSDRPFDPVALTPEDLTRPGQKPLPVNDDGAGEAMAAAVQAAAAEGDSVGGVVECAVLGLPVGLGGPLFDGMESRLSALLFGIPAVKGVEFGDGFAAAALRGHEHNDPYCFKDGRVATAENHAGGILGGLTTGMPLILRAAFKPTPSIARPQTTLRLSTKEPDTLIITGRHDPCVAIRAVPCVEAAVALGILDALLEETP